MHRDSEDVSAWLDDPRGKPLAKVSMQGRVAGQDTVGAGDGACDNHLRAARPELALDGDKVHLDLGHWRLRFCSMGPDTDNTQRSLECLHAMR